MGRKRSSLNYDKVLAFFVVFYKTNSFPPSIRQISDGTGVKSTSHVSAILETLSKEGKLRRYRRGTRILYGMTSPAPDTSGIITEQTILQVRRVSEKMHEPAGIDIR